MKFTSCFFLKNQDFSWNQKFENLHIFKEIFGHSNVPQRYENNPGLGAWVGKQRGNFFKYKLPRNRQDLLEKVNFDWAPGKIFLFNAAWNKRYQELKYFKAIYGHCNVPCNYYQNKELGFWVKNQRQFFKKKILEEKRIVSLTDVGFEFIRREAPLKMPWKGRFRELLLYLDRYGNVLVPQRSGALGKWVQKQRDLFRKKKLKKYRKDLLDTIFFVWNPRKGCSHDQAQESMLGIRETFRYYDDLFTNKYCHP